MGRMGELSEPNVIIADIYRGGKNLRKGPLI